MRIYNDAKYISLIVIMILTLLDCSQISAQYLLSSGTDSEQISPIDFSIPVSPAFDLLGVNPSRITRANAVRDIKVDWSFRSWRMAPNIAVQGQPIWEMLYNKADMRRYRNASPLMRMLSTLDISLGTVTENNLNRRVSGAVKLSLYRSRDPLLDTIVYKGFEQTLKNEKIRPENLFAETKVELDTTSDVLEKRGLHESLLQIEENTLSLDSRYKKMIPERAAKYAISQSYSDVELEMGFQYILDAYAIAIGGLCHSQAYYITRSNIGSTIEYAGAIVPFLWAMYERQSEEVSHRECILNESKAFVEHYVNTNSLGLCNIQYRGKC